MTRTLPPASRHDRAMRLELAVVGVSQSLSSASSVPSSLVHSTKAAAKGSAAGAGAGASTARRRLRCRQRRVEGRSGGGGSGTAAVPLDEEIRPARLLLGSPGRRSHEKGTTEVVVVVRGDGAGDVDGEKEEEAVDAEEDEEVEEALRFRRRGAVDGVDGSESGGGGSGSGSGFGCDLLVCEAPMMRETRRAGRDTQTVRE